MTLTIPGITRGALDTGSTGYGVLPLASKGALVFNPATSLTDGGGNSASGTLTTNANFKLF